MPVNYLVISWYKEKGTLTRCFGQTLRRQGGDREETGGYSVLCASVSAKDVCVCWFIRAVLHVPFCSTYWLSFFQLTFSHYRLFLLYACTLLLMKLEPLVIAVLGKKKKRVFGQRGAFWRAQSVQVVAKWILNRGVALKVCDICLICPEKTWSEFIY